VSWVWGTAIALAGLAVLAPLGRRWWIRRAVADPRRDPGAGHADRARTQALDALLASGADPALMVAGGLAICEVDDEISWRGGLRRLVPVAERLGADADAAALAAEVRLRLGEIDRARTAVAALPADHWRACAVRAGLYAVDRDEERADSALVAAAQLAPAAERDRLYERLDRRRRRRGFRAGPHLTLWERPP
jgi:hypothetical protein